MADALCIRCGFPKKIPWKPCKRCGLDPARDPEALVRSVYLSVGRFEDDDERERYRGELDQIRTGIEAGTPPEYDARELGRLRQQKALAESVTWWGVWKIIARLFLPVLVFAAVLIAIAFLLEAFFWWLHRR